MPTWVVIGASRGIGLEFVRQLLVQGHQVVATVRDLERASELWALAGVAARGACRLLLCDVASDASIKVTPTSDMAVSHLGNLIGTRRLSLSYPS